MPARCHNDSCSIVWSEVNTTGGPAYQADLNFDADASLECVEADGGMDVKLLRETRAALDPSRECANILYRNNSGQLFAVLPQVEQLGSVNEGYAAVPASADAASPADASLDFAYTNDSGCEQLIFLRGQFNLAYTILREASPVAETADLKRSGNITTQAPAKELIPFNAQWIMRLKRAFSGSYVVAMTPIIAEHFSASGVMIDIVTDDQSKSEWRSFSWMEAVPAGATIRFEADVFHDGPDQTLNIATSPGDDGDPARGFRAHALDLFVLPMQVL